MNQQERLRQIIAYLMAFILSVVLTLSMLLVGIKATIFNDTFILHQLDKSNYSNHVYDYFVDVSESLSILYGVDSEYLLQAFSKEQVETDILRSMRMILRNETPDFFEEQLTDDIKVGIIAFAQSIDLTMTEELEEGMNELTGLLVEDYTRIIQVPLFLNYAQAKQVVDQYIWWGIGAMILLSLFLMGFLLKLYRHRHRSMRLITYAVLAGGLMNLFILVPVYTSRFYDQIQISPNFFKILIGSIVRSSLSTMMFYSLGIFMLAGLLIFWSESMRNQLRKPR